MMLRIILFIFLFFATQASAFDVVFFKSAVLPYTTFEIKRAEKQQKQLPPKSGLQLLGRLAGPQGTGPFPAVVLLHGCGGIWRWNDYWVRTLVEWGYIVLDVDSLSPRGEWSVCPRPSKITSLDRALDAYGAKQFLLTLPDVDLNNIYLMGMSHGGWGVLSAVSADIFRKFQPFRAAVALYPGCDRHARFNAPLIVLIGEEDDWTLAQWCRESIPQAQSDFEKTLKIYPGVHHVFDLDGTDHQELGHILRYDQAAAEDAARRIRDFLSRHRRQ